MKHKMKMYEDDKIHTNNSSLNCTTWYYKRVFSQKLKKKIYKRVKLEF